MVGDSDDKKTRWIELRIPVTEGPRYTRRHVRRLRQHRREDRAAPAALPTSTKGEFYSLDNVRKGLEKAREVYGAGGYFEFTGFPDYKFRDEPDPAEPAAPAALRPSPRRAGPPIVDVTMRLVEGQQYFINRITFVGNTTTHDNVIRREMRLLEDGVFNTEALKFSIRRLNQLGYFKPLEDGQGHHRRQDAGRHQQGRRQGEAGGAEPQSDQLRRRRLRVRGLLRPGVVPDEQLPRAGARASPCRCRPAPARRTTPLAFTEPFLFDRNITGSVNVYRNDVRYIGQFTQGSTGGRVGFGYPLGSFTRLFTNYSYERVRVTEIAAGIQRSAGSRAQPLPARLAADRRERRAHHQQGHAEHRAQHGRPADLPQPGRPLYGLDRSPRRPGRQHQLLQALTRGDLVLASARAAVARHARPGRVHPLHGPARWSCRSSRSSFWAASIRCAGSTSGASDRRIPAPASCSAATRACCSTSSRTSTS